MQSCWPASDHVTRHILSQQQVPAQQSIATALTDTDRFSVSLTGCGGFTWQPYNIAKHSCTDSVLWQHTYNLCLLPFTSFFIFVSRFNFNPLQAGKIWAASFTVTYSWHLSMKAIYGNNKTENQDNIKASMPPQITKSLCWGAYLSLAVTERWLSAELSSFCKQPYGFMTRLSVTIKSITSIDQISPFINRCCVISSYFGCFRRQKASVTTTWK